MDIAGAKALKERLGDNAKDENPAPPADVPRHAPPVYHYLGVSETPPGTPAESAGEPRSATRSLFRRLRWLSP
jgi:hypothetical protein